MLWKDLYLIKISTKPNSQSWFTPECVKAISHHNDYYKIYHRERCSRNSCYIQNCQKSLQESYAQSVQANVENKSLFTNGFWKILKVKIPRAYYHNGTEVILTFSDKARLFAMNFAKKILTLTWLFPFTRITRISCDTSLRAQEIEYLSLKQIYYRKCI